MVTNAWGGPVAFAFAMLALAGRATALQTASSPRLVPQRLAKQDAGPAAAFQRPALLAPRRKTSSSLLAVSASAAQASSVVTTSAIRAILKLIGTCGIGVYAGKKGVLDKSSLAVLSKLVFNIFQPCLLFCNVAQTVASSSKGSAAVWILPFAASLQIFIGYAVGLFVTKVIYGNKESEEKRQTLTCTTFSNSGPLPLVFVDALFRAHPDQTLLPKAVAYISLYLLGWSPLFWIFAPAILSDPAVGGGTKSAAEKRNELLGRIFSPPVLGSLLGLVVGSVPLLSKQIISASGALNWLFEAMRTLGTAYLPAVLLVLAGSLTPTQDQAEQEAEAAKSPETRKEESRAFITQISTIYVSPSRRELLNGRQTTYFANPIFLPPPLFPRLLATPLCPLWASPSWRR